MKGSELRCMSGILLKREIRKILKDVCMPFMVQHCQNNLSPHLPGSAFVPNWVGVQQFRLEARQDVAIYHHGFAIEVIEHCLHISRRPEFALPARQRPLCLLCVALSIPALAYRALVFPGYKDARSGSSFLLISGHYSRRQNWMCLLPVAWLAMRMCDALPI